MKKSLTQLVLGGCISGALFLLAQPALAWKSEGHQVVGRLALLQASPAALARLAEIMGTDDPAQIAAACTWPDDYRATDEGAWTAPQHYLNVPIEAEGFEPGRDCREGACVAGAIKRYANELADISLEREPRWQAWARVCHFTADIHQPLHAGYRHDRGGNDFTVRFRGEEMNLHHFWDRAMINANYPEWHLLVRDLAVLAPVPPAKPWTPDEVDGWAIESHNQVRQRIYPATEEITPEFAAESWLLARQRLVLAGQRLARILDATLGQPAP